MKPSLIVHGGAGNIVPEAEQIRRAGIRRALEEGWGILTGGGAAVDAAEVAIAVLEDDPAFDAGFGSHLNLDGRVQLDAILMDGSTLKAGAVAAVERVRNPIRLARIILEKSEHMMLVAAGAEKFAAANGIPLCAPEELVTKQERAAWETLLEVSRPTELPGSHGQGTVGAVALDSRGNLFAGTSTGGTRFKAPGRVGDSPLIGCGCYADAEAGGVSCTGHGEGIMKIVMAKMAVDFLRDPSVFTPTTRPARSDAPSIPRPLADAIAQAVADRCVETLARRAHSTGGLILLDRQGRPAAAYNTPHMSYGFVEPDGSFRIGR